MEMGGVSVWILILIIALYILPLWIVGVIVNKAGFARWWALLMLVPLVNIIMIWVFAFSNWPSLKPDYRRNDKREEISSWTYLVTLIAPAIVIASTLFWNSGYLQNTDKQVSSTQTSEHTSLADVESDRQPVSPPIAKSAPRILTAPLPTTEIEPLKSIQLEESVITEDDNKSTVQQTIVTKKLHLQLASFRDERNALALAADLERDGYRTLVDYSSPNLFRVVIGPDTQQNLKVIRETVLERYSLDGRIVP